jgi:hypothetical protein
VKLDDPADAAGQVALVDGQSHDEIRKDLRLKSPALRSLQ